MHYVVYNKTAVEMIYGRADVGQSDMGLTIYNN